jgi:hypothetical protein
LKEEQKLITSGQCLAILLLYIANSVDGNVSTEIGTRNAIGNMQQLRHTRQASFRPSVTV